MATLNDYQIQLGDNGVVLGGTNPSTYKLENVEGLERDMRSQDLERVNADGSTQGPDYAVAKTVMMTINIIGSSPADAMTKYDALAADWAKARGTEGAQVNIPLRFKLPGRPAQRLNVGRPRRLAFDTSQLKYSLVRCVATYYAPDPKIVSDAERVIDLAYGAANATLPNAGNFPAEVMWDVYGDAASPGVIRNESARFDLQTTVAANTFFRVRTWAKTVTRSSDSANMYNTFAGTWLEIPPGGGQFRAVRSSGLGPYVRATYRDTWL